MGNATLLDVFQGAVGVTNQALGIFSQEKKEELDAIYFQENIRLKQDMDKMITDFKAVDLDGNNAYQNDPQLYRDYVSKTLQQWQDNAIKAGNNSPYYNDLVHRSGLAARADMEQRVYAAQVETEIQRADVALAKAYDATLQDAGMRPDEKLNILLALGAKRARINRAGPLETKQWNDKAYTDILHYYTSNNIQPTTQEDRDYLEHIKSMLPQDLPNRDKIIAEATDSRRSQIWNNNLEEMKRWDAEYNRLIRESTQGNKVTNQQLFDQAKQIYYRWEPRRDAALDSTEYAYNDRDIIAGMFVRPDIIDKPTAGSGGRVLPNSLVDRLKGIKDFWIQQTANQSHSITEGFNQLAEAYKRELEGTGFSIADLDYYHEGKLSILDFGDLAMDEADERLKRDGHEGIKEEQKRAVSAVLNSPEGQKYYKSLDTYEKAEFERFLNGAYRDLFADSTSGSTAGANAAMRQIGEGIVTRMLFSRNKPSFNARSERGINEGLRFIQENGDLLSYRDMSGNEVIAGREKIDAFAQAVKENFATRMRLPKDKITLVYDNDESAKVYNSGDHNEISRRFHFVVKGEGASDGIYRLHANDDSNKPYIIQREGAAAPTNVPSASGVARENDRATNAETNRQARLSKLDEAVRYLTAGTNTGSTWQQLQIMHDNGQTTEWDEYARNIDLKGKKLMSEQDRKNLWARVSRENLEKLPSLYHEWEKRGILPSGIQRPRNLTAR